jgi:hypothetical protein
MTASDLKSDSPAEPARPRRRWYQFSLRTACALLLVVSLLLGAFAWWRDRAERQRKVVEELRGRGAMVKYQLFSLSKRGALDDPVTVEEEFFLCAWLRNWLGSDYVYFPTSVNLRFLRSDSNSPESPESKEQALRLIANWPYVHELVLDGEAVRSSDLEQLTCFESLESLSFELPFADRHGLLTDDGLAVLEGAPCLERLILERQPIGDAAIKHLRNCRRMKVLSLEGTLIGDKGLEQLSHLTDVNELSLKHSRVTDKGLKHLRDMSKLRGLNLSENAINGDGLSDVGPKLELNTLNLANTRFGDGGLLHMSQFPQLEYLLLMQTNVTGSGIPYLAQRESRGIRMVSLEKCPITDVSIGAGIEIPDGWRYLVLDGAKFTDKGFCRLKFPQSIEQIDLDETDVTDVSLDHLQGLTKLEIIEISNTKITPDGIKRFNNRLPNCAVAGFPRQ